MPQSIGKDKTFGVWIIAGAQAGKKFGDDNQKNLTALQQINDDEFIRKQFAISQKLIS